MSGDAFFDLDGEVFVGRDPARGPWDERLCHAGPVAAAIARQVERAFGNDFRLVRLTMDLIRPVPMAGFSVKVETGRKGRRLAIGSANVVDSEGRTAILASVALLRPCAIAGPQPLPVSVNRLADASDGPFPISQSRHSLPAFGDCVDIRYPPGQTGTPGPTKLWMRTPPLLLNETPSSFQRLCPIADCGNAISRLAEVTETGFVNSDLTIMAHRMTNADWLMSDSISHWHPDGIGMSDSRIYDEDGPVATALQTLVIE